MRMKVVAKAIKMIAFFEDQGQMTPIRFRIEEDGQEAVTIKVDQICSVNLEKLAGNKMYVFKCQSVIDGIERPYELKYDLATCRWMLFKI